MTDLRAITAKQLSGLKKSVKDLQRSIVPISFLHHLSRPAGLLSDLHSLWGPNCLIMMKNEVVFITGGASGLGHRREPQLVLESPDLIQLCCLQGSGSALPAKLSLPRGRRSLQT